MKLSLKRHRRKPMNSLCLVLLVFFTFIALNANAEVTLETSVNITNQALHFDGKSLTYSTVGEANTSPDVYDYFFGFIFYRGWKVCRFHKK